MGKKIGMLVIAAILPLFFQYIPSVSRNPKFDAGHFLKSKGYPFENHNVTTEDGYIISLHRISHGRNITENGKNKTRPAVLVMHGLMCSSVDFMFMGPGESITLMLADAGYDVWVGNSRGNTFSRKHLTLNPVSDSDFWDFSYHELGVYDLPAMIDHILETTGNKKLFYIGHSQGTTDFFVMSSMKPEYNEKITLMTALAPVAYLRDLKLPLLKMLARNYRFFSFITSPLTTTGIFTNLIHLAFSMDYTSDGFFAKTIIFEILGYDPSQLDMAVMHPFIDHFPELGSIKQLNHLLQGTYNGGYFLQYDYGTQKNKIIYGSEEPTEYNISKITAPVIIYHSLNDQFVPKEDVIRLAEKLPNLVKREIVSYEHFSHGDFMYAKDLDTLLNKNVVNDLNKFIK